MAWGIRRAYDKLRTARRDRAEACKQQLDEKVLRLAAEAAANGLHGVHLYQLWHDAKISPAKASASFTRLERMRYLQRIDLGEDRSPRFYHFITSSGYWYLHQLDAAH